MAANLVIRILRKMNQRARKASVRALAREMNVDKTYLSRTLCKMNRAGKIKVKRKNKKKFYFK
jgi:DNA-binding MarR family transcriptional regulator